MESDCKIIMQTFDKSKMHLFIVKSSKPEPTILLIRFVIFVLTTSLIITPVCSIFVDCDSVTSYKKCLCSKSDIGWYIECPNEILSTYPVSLIVESEGNLIVKCTPELDEFKWDLIGGVDLSSNKIGSIIGKIEMVYCPMVNDSLQGFLNQVNIMGDQLTKFTFTSRIRNIKTIPLNFLSQMKNLEVLNLKSNKLDEVPDLSGLPKLKELNLRDNNIQVIPPRIFSQNKNLESIAFSSNKLNRIEPNAFPDTVKILDFSRNRISKISRSTFEGFIKLETLILDGNPLEEMEPDCFNNLPELQVLWLNSVRIKTFPEFQNLPHLTNLSMNYLMNGPINVSLLKLQNLPSLMKFEARKSKLINLPLVRNVSKLAIIILKSNKIQNLSSDFFVQLPSLVSLDISDNLLTDLVEIRSERLEKLDLSKNEIKTLPKIALRHLRRLMELNLSQNKIKEIDYFAFESLGTLRDLDMSQNQLHLFTSPFANMKSNDGFGLGDASMTSPFHHCNNLKTMNLSYNLIDRIYDDWRTSKIMLNNLDLSNNKIKYISSIDLDFIPITNLHVNFSSNEISYVDLKNYFAYLDSKSSSIDIYLNNNPLDCNCSAYDIKSFSLKSHRLHYDDLTCSSPENLLKMKLKEVPDKDLQCILGPDSGCPKKCQCRKRPVDSTIIVDCSKRGLKNEDLSEFEWNLKKEFRKGNVEVNLSRNVITEFKEEYISKFPERVQLIDLSDNSLTSIPFITSLKENVTVNLANNSFSCSSCSDFVLLWSAFSNRIQDSQNMTCMRKSENEIQTLNKASIQDISSLVEDCQPVLAGEIRLLIIIVAVLTVFCVLLIVFIFRYAWIIKAYIYSKGWGWCLFWDSDFDPEDEEKLYDAFVSYSHKDEDWVIEELVTKLEEKEGFKLCLHFRDWTPGDWIPDQIVKSVDQSKRTVVILTKNFVESVWSRLEFKAAHAQALSKRSNRVILVLLEDDLKEKDVKDDDLRVYMKMNTYLKWNDPWFWHKLKYALPHRKNQTESQDVIKKMEQRERAIQLDKLRAKLEQTV